MDLTGIPLGADFGRVIQERVDSCRALIAIIGKNWLTVTDSAGQRRIDRDDDYVRLEVSTALNGDSILIPVLVCGAQMPPPWSLPSG